MYQSRVRNKMTGRTGIVVQRLQPGAIIILVVPDDDASRTVGWLLGDIEILQSPSR